MRAPMTAGAPAELVAVGSRKDVEAAGRTPREGLRRTLAQSHSL
ncbi:hypothetical protein ACFV0T_31105 [Streptomyces sp. NPDC059582]